MKQREKIGKIRSSLETSLNTKTLLSVQKPTSELHLAVHYPSRRRCRVRISKCVSNPNARQDWESSYLVTVEAGEYWQQWIRSSCTTCESFPRHDMMADSSLSPPSAEGERSNPKPSNTSNNSPDDSDLRLLHTQPKIPNSLF